MDPLYAYYFVPILIAAFFAGFFLVEGNARKLYMAVLIVLIAVGFINMHPELRSRILHLLFEYNVPFPSLQTSRPPPPPAEPFRPFYVYQDKNSNNHFVPSGYMADHECVAFDDAWQEGPKAGRSSILVVYDTACSRKKMKWAGIYWQNPANNWGGQKGGYDLRGATKLVFWAKGEQGGEHILEFKVGGIGARKAYPDTAEASIKNVILEPEWREYTIDLRGKDLSRIAGGFAWSTSVQVNSRPCVFYLDEIRFE